MKFRVERYEGGDWVAKMHYCSENKDDFKIIANVTEFQYRIMCGDKDVTDKYRRSAK